MSAKIVIKYELLLKSLRQALLFGCVMLQHSHHTLQCQHKHGVFNIPASMYCKAFSMHQVCVPMRWF